MCTHHAQAQRFVFSHELGVHGQHFSTTSIKPAMDKKLANKKAESEAARREESKIRMAALKQEMADTCVRRLWR